MPSRAEQQLRVSRGATLIWDMGTVPMTFSINVLTAWRVPGALFTCQRDQARRSSWKPRPTCNTCCKPFLFPRRSGEPSKRVSQPWSSSVNAWLMSPPLLVQHLACWQQTNSAHDRCFPCCVPLQLPIERMQRAYAVVKVQASEATQLPVHSLPISVFAKINSH